MDPRLLYAGIACVIAAVVGGGLKAFGIEIPLFQSLTRQLILGLLGTVLILAYLFRPVGGRKEELSEPNSASQTQAVAERQTETNPTLELRSPDTKITESPAKGGVTIEITEIPPKGSGDPVKTSLICGKTTRVDAIGAQVVVYAFDNKWYVEPDANQAKTGINPDGSWCSTTHPGYSYAALLVRPGYTPPANPGPLPTIGGDILALRIVNGTAE